ncbi:MAG: molybdenum cofactor guanylyltransferase [Firmicutes bacterium]|nr:molybdenum cofactor guanylyltransferase [Clostridiales bacterium]MBQ9932025.1 molybdenum cofactor guanylyltransferase [Bacillota bacterium]
MKDFGSAVILAGGYSTRMGFDKQLIMINERRLFDSLYEILSPVFDHLMVSTYHPEYYTEADVEIVDDIFPHKGPLSGLHSALTHAKSRYVYAIACDMPIFNYDYIDYLKQEIVKTEPDACVTQKGDWIEPFHAFYSTSCLPLFEEILTRDKTSVCNAVRQTNLLKIPEEKALEFTPDWSLFMNLNTPDILETYLNNLR